jgi:hypothetical protein
MAKLRLLDPTTESTTEQSGIAPRLETLDGIVLGIYNNHKHNSVELLEMVAEEVGKHFQLKDVVRGQYHVAHLMKTDEWKDIERCDAIVLANGD